MFKNVPTASDIDLDDMSVDLDGDASNAVEVVAPIANQKKISETAFYPKDAPYTQTAATRMRLPVFVLIISLILTLNIFHP